MAQEYTYSPIKNLQAGYNNFYGIIYDSSFPMKEANGTKFVCTLKVIDPESNPLSNGTEPFIKVTVKSREMAVLPYVHTIGDIIRIHRGNIVSKFK